MKNLLYIATLICSLNCFGQSETKEAFLNEVYTTYVDPSVNYYYLSSEAVCLFSRQVGGHADDQFNLIRRSFKHVIPDTVTEQFITDALIDSVPASWECTRLESARCFDDSYDEHINAQVLPYVQELRNINYELGAERKKIEAQIERLPAEEKTKFIFSKPVYSRDHRYALIRFESRPPTGTNECFYLFRKAGEKWIIHSNRACHVWAIDY